MAQLSDDCFAFGGPLMSVDDAVAIIATRLSAVEDVETIALRDADGRILAQDLAAAVPAGRRLRPQDVALAAAFGLTRLTVRRRIRVAVFSTGDELVSPGAPRAPAQLFDSNRFMLMAMLARLKCEVSDLSILRDDR